ncbi:hypothetical protein DL96DRAFT_1552919 [Flagelloscypha sp. PMI_526]|nr:hypothetical protein DL96DRAFT_1552919 [Flagelloscypha sp. PMI_526]
MLSAPSQPSQPTDLPMELWMDISFWLTKEDLWALRGLNRTVFALASSVHYKSIWIKPQNVYHDGKDLNKVTMERLSEPAISRIVTSLHLHTNLEADPYPSSKKRTIHARDSMPHIVSKALSNSLPNLSTLTVHYDAVVLPYTSIVWSRSSLFLVHLELQFFSPASCKHIASLAPSLRCPKLRTFIISYAWGMTSPLFDTSGILLHMKRPNTRDNEILYLGRMFKRLASLVPPEVESLGIHYRYDSYYANKWTVGRTFLNSSRAFLRLKKLHLTSMSVEDDKDLAAFLIARTPTLKSLTLEDITDKFPKFLRYIKAQENLKELRLSVGTYLGIDNDVHTLDPQASQPWRKKIEQFSNLQVLNIKSHGNDNWYYRGRGNDLYLRGPEVMSLAISLAKAGSTVEELVISASGITYSHLSILLVLLPCLDRLSFSPVVGVEDWLFPSWNTWRKRKEVCGSDGMKPYGLHFSRLRKEAARMSTQGWRNAVSSLEWHLTHGGGDSSEINKLSVLQNLEERPSHGPLYDDALPLFKKCLVFPR